MPLPTIKWEGNSVHIIDQTKLPLKKCFINISKIEEMWDAIKKLKIRGAPAIGIAAAFGIYLGVRDYNKKDFEGFLKKLNDACDYIGSSRPTAVNLFWAIERIKKLILKNNGLTIDEIKSLILKEANLMIEEDNRVCLSIGENGVKLIRDGNSILTHCNAGGLATAMYGTALSPIFKAKELGLAIHVWVDETRPLLQGSRITAWELVEANIPATLITDNMAAFVMSQGKVDMVIVGADRIAANGDTANKIGTLGIAVLSKEFHIPFYIAAPVSTIDINTPSGSDIPIEERNASEVINGFGRQTAPSNINVYNPAFDITPYSYIKGIITEKGIISPPFTQAIKKILNQG